MQSSDCSKKNHRRGAEDSERLTFPKFGTLEMFRSYHLLELSLFKIENGFNPELILRVLCAPAYCRQVCGAIKKIPKFFTQNPPNI
jgi:hypothetical protein